MRVGALGGMSGRESEYVLGTRRRAGATYGMLVFGEALSYASGMASRRPEMRRRLEVSIRGGDTPTRRPGPK